MTPLNPAQKIISRRSLIRGFTGLGLLWLSGIAGCTNIAITPEIGVRSPGLRFFASKRERRYGVAVQSGQFDDAGFARTIAAEANLLVPENELKWDIAHPAPDTFDFAGYRRLAAFAQENAMAMRGHTLVWHHANPDWLEGTLTDRATAEKILRTHIETVLAETRPVIRNWDVVNEAIDPRSKRADGLRDTLWLRALGPDYIETAFHIAHEADPNLTLTYNDFSLEHDNGYARAKRKHVLRLLEDLRKRGVPVHALGLQSHLLCNHPLGGNDFTNFLKEVRGLGLQILVTELDLDVSHVIGPDGVVDESVQAYVRAWLELVRASGPVDTLLTWGLSDRYSWLKENGTENAGMLPLDINLERTPFWATLRDSWLGN